jgi:chemotaxis protein methyltransferase CheR
MSIRLTSLTWVCELLDDRAGNVLDASKAYLIESRLAPLAQAQGLADVDEFVEQIRSSSNAQSERAVVEAMLTHESSFFRDPHYFEEISRRIVPTLMERRQDSRRLKIWCAACAAGQEPYSLAMQVCEQYVDHQSTIEIIGTDLSRAMLDQARSGSYSDIEIRRGVSEERRRRFFRSDGRRWKLDDKVQSLVRFQPLNLCTDSAPFSDVDLILIRNVLIYLNDRSRDRILSLISASLAKDGLLILGATETLYQHAELFARADYNIPVYRRNA